MCQQVRGTLDQEADVGQAQVRATLGVAEHNSSALSSGASRNDLLEVEGGSIYSHWQGTLPAAGGSKDTGAGRMSC